MTAQEMMKALAAPFREDEYEWRVQMVSVKTGKVQVLCYVQARAIMNRLDEVCPFAWQVNYEAGPDGGVLCSLGIQHPETGGWLWRSDGAANTDIEAVKGGISSALKRAANTWGIGRLLYSLDSAWVPLSDSGTHYHKGERWTPPKLPDWAVSDRTRKPVIDKEEVPMELIRSESGRKRLLECGSVAKANDALAAKYIITDESDAFVRELFEGAGQ